MSLFIHWLSMNGYGYYIWSAYGAVFGVLAVNVLLIWRQRIRTRQLLRQWFDRLNYDA